MAKKKKFIVTRAYIIQRIKGDKQKARHAELVALLAEMKHGGLQPTKRTITKAILDGKGKVCKNWYERIASVDTETAVENARIAKFSAMQRAIRAALIADQPHELFQVFETVKVFDGVDSRWEVGETHELLKVPEYRLAIARRFQHMEKNGTLGIVRIKKFVMLATGKQFPIPPLPQ